MKNLLILVILATSVAICNGAARGSIGGSDFKTPTGVVVNRQTLLFSQMTNSSSLTIACWLKYDWTDAGVNSQLGGGAKQGLVHKGRFEQSGGDGNLQFGLSSVSEKIGFSFSSPNGTYHIWRTTANSVQTNTWMHIAVSYTYSNAASLVFYVNGVNTAGSWGTGTGNAVGETNATTFHTFIYTQNGGSSFFGGAMSDLAIWTNALTAGDIFKLSSSKVKYMPIQVKPDSLLFYWPMDTTPVLTSPSAFNVDVDRTKSTFNLDIGGLMYGERTLSYQPNE